MFWRLNDWYNFKPKLNKKWVFGEYFFTSISEEQHLLENDYSIDSMLNSLRNKFDSELASTHENSYGLSSDFTCKKLPLSHHEISSSRQDRIKWKLLLIKNTPSNKPSEISSDWQS